MGDGVELFVVDVMEEVAERVEPEVTEDLLVAVEEELVEDGVV